MKFELTITKTIKIFWKHSIYSLSTNSFKEKYISAVCI